LRVLVARGGKFVKSDDSAIGQPLLYSVEEWFERRKGVSGRYHTRLWLTFSLTIFLLWVLFDLLLLRDFNNFGILWWIMYFLMFAGLTSLGEVWHNRKDRKIGLCSGLYEGGIYFRAFGYAVRLFIPYDQIETFTPKSWFGIEALTLKLRGFRWKTRLTLMPTILGPDGLILLKQKVSGIPEPVEPPQLVIYGGSRFKMGRGPSHDIITPPTKRM
jgi:hypothetical protein